MTAYWFLWAVWTIAILVSIGTGFFAHVALGRSGTVWGIFSFACQTAALVLLYPIMVVVQIPHPDALGLPAGTNVRFLLAMLLAVMAGGGFAWLIVATLPRLNRV
jgi:hypothetical protein